MLDAVYELMERLPQGHPRRDKVVQTFRLLADANNRKRIVMEIERDEIGA